MATVSTNTLTGFIPEIWSKKLLKNFNNLVVMAKLVNTDHEGEVAGSGSSVKVRVFGDVAISNYTRDTVLAAQNLTTGVETMSIDQAKYFMFTIDDLDKAQSDLKIIDGYSNRAAIAIRDVVDTRLLSHYADTDAANIIGTATIPVTLTKDNIVSYFLTMGKNFDDQKQPEDNRMAVCTPHVKRIILEYLSARSTPMGDTITKNGQFMGDFVGWTLYCSTNVPVATNSKPVLFFNRDYISYASQVNKTEAVRPTDTFSTELRGLFLYGSKAFVAHDGCGGVLYSAPA